jgi:hypothetical protein
MKFNPSSLHFAPVALPLWQTILDDLGDPHPARVAKVLGVGVRTVYRWNREQRAPRAACLALFWLTRWGRGAVDAEAVNACQLAVQYASALEAQLHRTEAQLAQVLALNATGAANDPVPSFLETRNVR